MTAKIQNLSYTTSYFLSGPAYAVELHISVEAQAMLVQAMKLTQQTMLEELVMLELLLLKELWLMILV